MALPLGVVSLTEKYFAAKHRKNDELFNCRDKITAELLKLGKSKVNIERCLAVAGTPTTLACLKKGMTEYFEEQIEGQVLTKSDLIEFVDELSTLNPNEIRVKYNNVVQGREDLILTGTLLLLQCLEYLDIEMVEVSTRGLRYGRIYEFFTNDY
ncbi:MAG: hypothetical protein HXY50_01060 [Ignavibacteriaceae bacterium]|nr:hypothetical protein [Ignavibacteriaceae bacterium]